MNHNTRFRRRPMRTAAATALALLAAACGGSSGSHVAQIGSTAAQRTSSAGTSAASTPGNGALAYANCVRAHGVPNWPEPNSSGVFEKSKLTLQQLGVSNSRLQAAQTACRHLLPRGSQPPNQAQLQQSRAQALSFSRCVRAHGVANFPDPDSDGLIPDPASVGIDQGSPTFEAANNACGTYRPPYMPSNSAYNAWAKTQNGA
jgi:hypothetical protein